MAKASKAAPSCGTCTFCLPHPMEDAAEGTCRRLPPIPMMKIDGNVVSAFPQVRLADIWCGEFKARRGT
jgi:hypothetical protein